MSIVMLKQVFREALDLPANLEDQLETLTYRSIDQWDSIAHMRLVSDLESAFDILLETEDVLGLSSFEMARQILAKHGVNTDA
ncbi:MAG: acyl carrier protein [Candidatus Sericytochromatia bacterium]|nr:acyl carrier protein [Candidatus Sericytochromatia bacterium]